MSCWHCDRAGCAGWRYGECPTLAESQAQERAKLEELREAEAYYAAQVELMKERAPA